jgi:TetR/AcrR family transcriptional repressor of uid operon
VKQEERSQETRSRILQAAERSFAERGYDITSVDSICRAAEISKGGFYHHFPSKGAVFAALLDAWLARLDAGFLRAKEGHARVPDQIAAMAASIDSIYDLAGSSWNILLEVWAKARTDPAAQASTLTTLRRYQKFFAELLQRGVDEGSLTVDDVELQARVLLSAVLGLLLQGILEGGSADWGRETKRTVSFMMDSVVRRTR